MQKHIRYLYYAKSKTAIWSCVKAAKKSTIASSFVFLILRNLRSSIFGALTRSKSQFLTWHSIFWICLLSIYGEEITVDLRNPTYQNGILYTDEGGVIQGDDFRIQARAIQYTQKKEGDQEIQRIEAEGDLLIQYKGKVYTGSELEYDLITKTGTIFQGRTAAAMWFVAGDEITLKSDGSYKVKNVSITACENKDSSWDLHAFRVNVLKEELFEAKRIRFRWLKLPLLWFPSLKLNLKKFREPIFRYTVNWDKGQGPRAAIRYQLYSWSDFAFYGRLEYRWRTGWGGALETEYFPEHKRTTFVTRSYLGKDRLQTAPDAMRRYRLQGAFNSISEDEKTTTALIWDKYNDVRMPTIFRPDDFEVSTAKKTYFYIRHREEAAITSFRVRPRANTFESIKQDLPSAYANIHSRAMGNTGIYNFLSMKAAYVDFAYSDDLVRHLPDFHSGRIEVREKMQRPISIGAVTLTPFAGFHGIFYSNSPSHEMKTLGVLQYGFDLFARGEKRYSRYKHVVEPYLSYHALTHPTVDPDDHYIFSIADGVNQINQIQSGIRTLLFSKRRPCKEASFSADIYANAFFKDPTIPQFIPRCYLLLNWRLPSLHFTFHNCWNIRHDTLDFSKARLLWTVGENVALTFEARYRSKFDWRKADHESFILDVTRTETQLLLSPLSDRRITFLSNIFIRLNPLWESQISLISGFYRMDEKPYTQVKVDLSTWISSSFRARVSYSHIRKDDRISFHVDLVKKQS